MTIKINECQFPCTHNITQLPRTNVRVGLYIFFLSYMHLTHSPVNISKNSQKGKIQCSWTIVAPEATNLKFNFVDLNMPMDRGNCHLTFLLITSMDMTLKWKLCGSNPGSLILPSNAAYVKLVAHDKITEHEKASRFKAVISATNAAPNTFQHGQTIHFPQSLTPQLPNQQSVPRNQVGQPQVQLKAAIVPTFPDIYDYSLAEPVLPGFVSIQMS